MRENKLRQLLLEGKPSVSSRIWSTWPYFIEAMAATHYFDYVEFVGEYAPFSQCDLENMVRAAELHNMASMIKVDFQGRGYVAQKAIGSGFQAILFTDHETPDQVRESIRLIKPKTPEDRGMFGFPSRRYIGTQPYLSQMDHAARVRDIVVCFMIENSEIVEHIDEVCSIPGVDMIQFGPNDFSLSLGKNRSDCQEELLAIERHCISTALRYGVQPRCEITCSAEAQYYIDLGVRHFSIGDQFKILRKFWEEEGERMQKIVDQLITSSAETKSHV